MSVSAWLPLFQKSPEEERKIGEAYRLIRIKEDYDRIYDWLWAMDRWDESGRKDRIGGLTGGKPQMVRMIKPDSIVACTVTYDEMPPVQETQTVDVPTMIYLNEIPKHWADYETRGLLNA